MKVGYVQLNGYGSKAYLNEEADENGVHLGQDKHNGTDIAVKWNALTEQWCQVPWVFRCNCGHADVAHVWDIARGVRCIGNRNLCFCQNYTMADSAPPKA